MNILCDRAMHKPFLFLQSEHNAGIPGTLISTSCVSSPSLGTTSCLMRLRSSLTHTDCVTVPAKTLFGLDCAVEGEGEGDLDVFSQHSWLL